ncbi:MAG: hypothetical protein MH321_15465 [Leptospiraceae bacterium]|nr:hypothetical protein [Leptospiraceae bacterium]
MFRLTTAMMILALGLSFNCGKEEPVEETTEEVSASAGSGSGSNSKVKAYEDFVTKFCALTEKMKTASATESVALAKDFASDSATFKTMTADMNDLKAASSDDQKAKIDAANKKGAACATSAAGTKISAPDIKKEIPKEIPKSVPTKLPGM